MKKLLIVGYFGFENFGDEWLLINLIKLIRRFSTAYKEIYILYNVKEYKRVNDVHYIPRWNFFWIVNVLARVNTVIYCGGVFQDYTSLLSIFYYLFVFLLAKFLFKKVILLNTEFSFKRFPFFIVKLLCSFSDVVVLRNELEMERILKYYKQTKHRNKILFCPDICYIDSNRVEQHDSSKKDFKKVALMIKSEKNELEVLINFCKSLLGKYKLVFIPLHLKEDYEFCLKIAEQIKNCEIRVWNKVEDYRFMLGDVDLVITSRLHGVVISDNLNIPFICFSKQNKIKDLILSNYKAKCISLNKLDPQKLEKNVIYPSSNKEFFCNKVEIVFKTLSRLNYI